MGTLLLAVLWLRAVQFDIHEFHGYTLADNYAVLDWFRSLGATMKLESGHFHFVLKLDEESLKPTATSGKLRARLEELAPLIATKAKPSLLADQDSVPARDTHRNPPD